MTNSRLICRTMLTDEKSFYPAFLGDLDSAKHEVIIESPYITSGRLKTFRNIFTRLLDKHIALYVITRDPREHQAGMDRQSEAEIRWFEENGIQTLLCTGNHHRKLAVIDRTILWEGSLNILSHTHSREIMRRLEGRQVVEDTIKFLNFGSFLD